MATIVGNNAPNELFGTRLADLIRGFGGNDEIEARAGNDQVYGGAGNDEIDGDAGNDTLYGDSGNDELDGDTGNDWLLGGTGNDDLDGGAGNDRLSGGVGNDHLDGGAGNDVLIGGAGRDIFEFERGERGTDRITDWTDGQDRIDLDDFDFSLARALSSGRQVGDDVRFDFAGSIVIVEDATLSNFGAADFIL